MAAFFIIRLTKFRQFKNCFCELWITACKSNLEQLWSHLLLLSFS